MRSASRADAAGVPVKAPPIGCQPCQDVPSQYLFQTWPSSWIAKISLSKVPHDATAAPPTSAPPSGSHSAAI